MINRREFAKYGFSFASAAMLRQTMAQSHVSTGSAELDLRQSEIDEVAPKDFVSYYKMGSEAQTSDVLAYTSRFKAIGRLEKAFDKVFDEARSTVVTDINHPAIWYLYNMGLIVKTPKTMFSVDLHHRRAEDFAPLLDFALITHNHGDHYTERFKDAMDRVQRKPVVNNFFCNYGVKDRKLGGYTRAKRKVLQYGDVKVIIGLCDHNSYLIDYTSTFEIHIGNFTLFHSGDCCSYAKFDLSRRPDIWVFHPYCGMNATKACQETVRPKLAVIAHLQEMGHAKGRYRWTYRDGLNQKAGIESAGFAARMPLWGERLA
ncbi:MAG: MBL fold metallo-hydrolase [Kiritimatiellae bacterium]|nr:MBL fold metallo-hydrolase [Kiritimatiellia bacterium]